MNHQSNRTDNASRRTAVPGRPWLFAIAVFFLLVQYASLLHAAEHPFHAETAACHAFIAVDKNKTGVDSPSLLVASYETGETSIAVSRPLPVFRPLKVYLSRAPPLQHT